MSERTPCWRLILSPGPDTYGVGGCSEGTLSRPYSQEGSETALEPCARPPRPGQPLLKRAASFLGWKKPAGALRGQPGSDLWPVILTQGILQVREQRIHQRAWRGAWGPGQPGGEGFRTLVGRHIRPKGQSFMMMSICCPHQVASAASDGLSRLDLDALDSRPPVLTPGNDDNAAPPREALRPLLPPAKPSPAPEVTALGDRGETPVGERAPTPVSASSEAQPESQEDAETAVGEDSSSEQLPRVLPEKLKVSWDNSSPEEPPVPESAEPPQVPCSETSESSTKEGGKPPTPPPKILSEKLRASMIGVEASGPARSPGASETSAPGSAQVSVNGVDDSPEPVEPSQAAGTPGIPPENKTASTVFPWELPPQSQPRRSSMGDLLGEGPRRPQQRLYRAQLEVQVASEQTEKLLNKMLASEPVPVSAEMLLSEAVEQLRHATQALQEIRDLGDLSQEAPGLREKRKELVTLYRRSAP